MFNNIKFKQFAILTFLGFIVGVFVSYILDMLTMISFYNQYKSLIVLIFSFIVWFLIILFNTKLYNKNIDADINIGFNINPVFLGLIFGIVFSFWI